MKISFAFIVVVLLILTNFSFAIASEISENKVQFPKNDVNKYINDNKDEIKLNNINYQKSYNKIGLEENNEHGGSWLDSFSDESGIDSANSDYINTSNEEIKINMTPPKQFKVDNHTMGLWHFNEGSGSTANDASTNNNDGTISGCTWTNGRFNKALDYGGGTDRVVISDDSSLDFSSSESFTLEAWFKTSSSPVSILIKYVEVVNNAYYSLWVRNDGRAQFSMRCSNNILTKVMTKSQVTDNQWHYLAGVRDTSDDKLKIYLDGKMVNSTTDNSTGSISNSADLKFGKYTGGSAFNFNGIIDESRISNKARSAEEIADHWGRVRYYANVTSKQIDLPQNKTWDTLIVNKTVKTDNFVNVTILNASDNQILSGSQVYTNEGEFDISYIDSKKYPAIKLNATFKSNGLANPTLNYWGVSWNSSNEWCDTFFGGLKVDMEGNLDVKNGKVEFENTGVLRSNSINIPDKCYFDVLSINKSQPIGSLLKISILDGQSNSEISGYSDYEGYKMNISGIDPIAHSSIKLKAVFSAPGPQIGELFNWSVNWTKNVEPKILDVKVNNRINRTLNTVISLNATDPNEVEEKLTFKAEYKSPVDINWRTEYLSTPTYIDDHWELEFHPPADAAVGTYSFQIICNDSYQEEDIILNSQFLKVLNNVPIIQKIETSANSVKRLGTVNITLNATDIDATPDEMIISIKYRSPVDTNWRTLNPDVDYYYSENEWCESFTPLKTAILGDYIFNITCNDTLTEVYQIIEIQVLNHVPIIQSVIPSAIIVKRMDTIDIMINVTDGDATSNDLKIALKYKSPLDSEWIVITSNVDNLGDLWRGHFTPNKNAALGEYTLNISCNDSVIEVFELIDIEVINNKPEQPTVVIIPAEPKTKDNLDVLVSKGKDVETPTNQIEFWYRWYVDDTYMPGFDNFTQIPSNLTTKHETWNCEVFAFDGDGLGEHGAINVTINNSAPELVEPFDRYEINEDIKVTLKNKLTNIFNDSDDDKLTFTAVGQKNVDILIYQDNGTIIFTPASNWFGLEVINFFVEDDEQVQANETLILTVNPTNDLPRITQIGSQIIAGEPSKLEYIVKQKDWLNLSIRVSDIDGDVERGMIKYIMNITERPNLYFKKGSNELTFRPSNSDVGMHYITVRITDNNETPPIYISQNIVIQVLNVNDPPTASILQPSNNKKFVDAKQIILDCEADDIDFHIPNPNEELSYKWESNITGHHILSFDKRIVLTNETLPKPGAYYIRLTVTDKAGLNATETINIIVQKTPRESKTGESTFGDYFMLSMIMIIIIVLVIIAILIITTTQRKKRHREEAIGVVVPPQEVLQPVESYRSEPEAAAISAPIPVAGGAISAPVTADSLEGAVVAPPQSQLAPTPAAGPTPAPQLPSIQPTPTPQPGPQPQTAAGVEVTDELSAQDKIKLLEERLLRGEISEETYLNLKDKIEFESKPFEPSPQLPPATGVASIESEPTPPTPETPQPTMEQPVESPPVTEAPPISETPTDAPQQEPPMSADLPPDAYQQTPETHPSDQLQQQTQSQQQTQPQQQVPQTQPQDQESQPQQQSQQSQQQTELPSVTQPQNEQQTERPKKDIPNSEE